MSQKAYVVGFLFRDREEVSLVLKTHPAWQKDKLNGVGGGIDGEETPLEAMRREFIEEAGVDVPDWREYALLREEGVDIYFFAAHGSYNLQSLTEEKVDWYKLDELKKLPIINNLEWLIPLALDSGTKRATIEYSQNK